MVSMSCTAVAGLGVLLAVLRWGQANRVATVVSCLAAVAAVGVGIWAAIPARRTHADPHSEEPADPARSIVIRVSETGTATVGHGGRANTGILAPKSISSESGEMTAEQTGSANASRDSDANTGIRLD
ncbi:hypothetical protein ACIBO6_28650 [Streptomyces luteogriseus]|uniref:hypothetical protein n=1 Tax=Streptomyces luteogriseus TaxID=68233 RepID=UPI00378B1FAF